VSLAGSANDRLLIPAREASRRLSIRPEKLRELTKSGQICAIRLGPATVLYSPRSLRKWITEQEKVTRQTSKRKRRE
jgi:hypothetical protein